MSSRPKKPKVNSQPGDLNNSEDNRQVNLTVELSERPDLHTPGRFRSFSKKSVQPKSTWNNFVTD